MSLYNLAKENRTKKILYSPSASKADIYFAAKSKPLEYAEAEEESESGTSPEVSPVKRSIEEIKVSVIPGKGTAVLTKTQQDYFNLLTKYIPTESITLYVAFMSAIPAFEKDYTFLSPMLLYWCFAILTPVFYLLWDYGQFKQELKQGLTEKYSFPLWNISASFVAFLCWALAVPNSPYLTSEAGGILAALLALTISTILGLVERIVK